MNSVSTPIRARLGVSDSGFSSRTSSIRSTPFLPCPSKERQAARRDAAGARAPRCQPRNAIFRSDTTRLRRSVWRAGNARRGGAATLAATLALAAATAASAQSQPLLPSASETMAAYQAVEQWIRDWRPPEQARTVDPTGAVGASVTLRLGGRIVGRETVMERNGENVWRAARGAWIEANQRIPVARDALRRERLKSHASSIAIDVQIAGAMTPLSGDSYAEATAEVAPGVQGVAARKGDRVEAVFPGAMLSSNMTPAKGVMSAAGELDLPAVDLATLKEKHGLIVYRFEVQHLAQPEAGEPPTFLFRGGKVKSLSSVDAAAIRAFGDGVMEYLRAHRWPENQPFGLLGTYKPWLAEHAEPMIAPPRDQALAAFALAKWARLRGERTQAGAQAAQTAERTLEELARVVEGEEKVVDDAPASALVVLARRQLRAASRGPAESSRKEAIAELHRRCVERIVKPTDQQKKIDTRLPPPARALIAHALAATPRLEAQRKAQEQVDSLLAETPPGEIVSLMPWIGWAQLTLAGEDGSIPAAVALRDFRSVLWEHQLTPADAGEDQPDLVGGIVFTQGRTSLPTWQSTRPLAFAAAMLGEPRLTDPDEQNAELSRLMRSMRFVMQLAVDRAVAHMFPNRGKALGGVRLALWDQRQSVEAQAMGLLCAAETLHSVQRLARRREQSQ